MKRNAWVFVQTVSMALLAALSMADVSSGQQRMQTARPADTSRYYQQGADGEWRVDADVVRGDGRAQWLLTFATEGGDQPVAIEATITLNGKPYPEATDQIVDRMLAVAKTLNSATSGDGDENEKSDSDTSDDAPVGLAEDSWRTLRHYAETNAASLDDDEARWMIARTTGGPALLTMRRGAVPARLSRSPLWHWLDIDSDNVLSTEEVQAAPRRLAALDSDHNGAIEATEWPRTDAGGLSMLAPRLVRVADTSDTPPSDGLTDGPLELGAASDLAGLSGNGQPPESAGDDSAIFSDPATPRLHLVVRLGDTDKPLLEIESSEPTELPTESLGKNEIGETTRVTIAGQQLYVTVMSEIGAKPSGAATAHQVSVGVAPVGGVIRDAVDTNRDGRLTPREVRDAAESLKKYDGDADGRIDVAELPQRFRLVFSAGPTAHAILTRDVPLPSTGATSSPAVSAPAWFATMDLNRDGDLSPAEFLGTADVFKSVDTDSDGLISVAEAAQLDKERSSEPK